MFANVLLLHKPKQKWQSTTNSVSTVQNLIQGSTPSPIHKNYKPPNLILDFSDFEG